MTPRGSLAEGHDKAMHTAALRRKTTMLRSGSSIREFAAKLVEGSRVRARTDLRSPEAVRASATVPRQVPGRRVRRGRTGWWVPR
ncbi:hypothetical protein FRAHR75_610024 [Frankia sp. Hr75.2]|nr:hypothetical protein FRAHR75_610024 [Frankia sp. Hr75.2]SQD97442.1 hypothetical protein FMEAI12_4110017 [Parafrankia sp. Ea1.12]